MVPQISSPSSMYRRIAPPGRPSDWHLMRAQLGGFIRTASRPRFDERSARRILSEGLSDRHLMGAQLGGFVRAYLRQGFDERSARRISGKSCLLLFTLYRQPISHNLPNISATATPEESAPTDRAGGRKTRKLGGGGGGEEQRQEATNRQQGG